MIHRHIALTAAIATLCSGPAFAGGELVLSQGQFAGASGHVTTGRASLIEKNGSYYVALGADFSFDGAPDPKVALGRDGFQADTLLGPLKANSGAQNYQVPDGINAGAYNEVWIWCEQFNVPLGSARLSN